MKQRHDENTRPRCCRDGAHLVGVDTHMRAISQIELPQLDQDGASGFGAGRVARLGRIADVAAGGKIAVLIGLKTPSITRNSSPPVWTWDEKWLPGA
jgi:hypothetical protein